MLSKETVHQQYKDSGNLRARARIYELFSTSKYDWNRWVFDQFDPTATSRVLELGCGPGALWARNIDRIPRGWQITLSDLSEGMVTEARQSVEASGRTFRFAVCDAQSVPFHEESFDAVIANHMLYHVPDRKRVYSEIYRVLKTGGRLYATTVGGGHLRELQDLVRRVKPEASENERQRFEVRFGLETGRDQLAEWFAGVEVRRNNGELVVTDVEPLIDYVQSAVTMRLNDHQVSEFRKHAQQEVSVNGAIRITTAAGIFIARKDGQQPC